MSESLSHLTPEGRAQMVDISDKSISAREAEAIGQLICSAKTLEIVREGKAPKGAVISTAELAGIMAAKKTADLIPLCHPLALSKVSVHIEIKDSLPGFEILAKVKTSGQTGVEMEALTAVTVAALTLYDMLKAVDKSMHIDAIKVTAKTGGKTDLGSF
jgi:cyclic pyranopterin monophosphate synthase